MHKIKYIAAALIAVACLGLQHAKADSVNYSLNIGNGAVGLGAGPYGTVTVNLTDPTHATITFTAASGYLFVDGGAVAVNVNAGTWSVSSFTVNAGANGVTNVGSHQEDGFGIFNQAGSQANSSNGASVVSFTLTNTSGTWASASQVLISNAGGGNGSGLVAAHIQVVGGPNNGVTGFAAGSTVVPDGGATVMLLGVALGALGMVRRYLIS